MQTQFRSAAAAMLRYHPSSSIAVAAARGNSCSRASRAASSVTTCSTTSIIHRGSCRPLGRHYRWNSFSTSPGGDPQPLFLWLGESDGSGSDSAKPRVLLPATAAHPSLETQRPVVVTTVEEIVQAVNAHYGMTDSFVGGMGEQDPGVWFAAPSSSQQDPVECYAELIRDSVQAVKEERHGVPFGVYTTGVVTDMASLSDLGMDSFQVSLFAANPVDYEKATGRSKKDFGAVCGFIVTAAEQGVAVEVSILKRYASEARDLALSLGARDVHVFE